ncbi:NAD dependent epimerase/dehydratase [Glonium stellatum]|uniref:NAD dependent epimerase/dehydratase n=1 Tax=Glonium stellatum TaxID=574774 RepID=A0A8E2JNT4_9PEZI|nr:NAD dependent epimerase/dehydratase [Glonium stellatum]
MASTNSSTLILLTGATGHIGFRVLIHCLTAGYSVRAAVRSPSKATFLLTHPTIQRLNPGPRLTCVLVPDLAAPAAYNDAVTGAHYIIHIASPLMAARNVPAAQHAAFFIDPAVRGTLNMLQAAATCGTIRRVVITSSIAALIPVGQLNGKEPQPRAATAADRIPLAAAPYDSEFAAYAASKVAALAAAETWVRDQQPDFDVVHLHPSFVEGRNEIALSAREALKGTNALVLGIALGKRFDSIASATVLLEDVARAHVGALMPHVEGGRSYVLSQSTRWERVREVVAREFPEAVQKRVLPNCGNAETHVVEIEVGDTEEAFGFRHAGLEEQVRSVVGHYLELRAQGRASLRPGREQVRVGRQVRANA